MIDDHVDAGPDVRWQDARRLLCVRLDTLGGVLLCTPAMRTLRAALPGRTLTLLSSPSGAAAAPFLPEIDAVITADVPWMNGGTAPSRAGDDMAALAARLAAGRFDGAVIFTTYTQSALPAAMLCTLAGIPLRLAHCREHPYGLLSDWVREPEPASFVRHEVQRQLALVRRAGGVADGSGATRDGSLHLSFVPRAQDVATAQRRLGDVGVDLERPWLLLHPGASAASRRYPAALWAQAIRLLDERLGMPLVLAGGSGDVGLVEAIRAEGGAAARSLAGRLDLGALGAALALATVAVTSNTAPAHIAAAVGTPVVDLYALTDPQHTPWQVPNRVLFHDVPCRFCSQSVCPAGHGDCLAGVAPGRVADAVQALLAQRRPRPQAQVCSSFRIVSI
jgi:ADP-heptose:LPS heptosyltransferase